MADLSRRAVRRPLDEALVALGQRALEPLVALAPLLSLVLRGFELELAELALLLEKTGDRVEERHEVVVHGLLHRGKRLDDHTMDQYTAAQEKQSQVEKAGKEAKTHFPLFLFASAKPQREDGGAHDGVDARGPAAPTKLSATVRGERAPPLHARVVRFVILVLAGHR